MRKQDETAQWVEFAGKESAALIKAVLLLEEFKNTSLGDHAKELRKKVSAFLEAISLPKPEPSDIDRHWEAFKEEVRMRLNRGDGPRSFVIERVFDVINAREKLAIDFGGKK